MKQIVKGFGIKWRPTMVKISKANATIEPVHEVITDMLRKNDLDNHTFDPVNQLGNLAVNISHPLRSYVF